jgi:integrase
MKLPEGLYRPKYRDPKSGELKESAILWVRHYHNGKKVRLSTGTDNVRKAVEFRNKCLGRASQGRPMTAALHRTTFENLASLVTDNYSVNEFRSLRRIKEALEHVRGFFGPDLARDITTDRINAYIISRREQEAANATINRELAALRRGFKLAAQTNPPRVDNVPFFPHLKEASARRGFFEREQFDAVLSHLPHYLKAPFTVSYITGWRTPSEVLTRQKSHLNMGAGFIRLEPNESKTGEPREFPIDAIPELREVLERQLETTRQLEVKKSCIIPWLFHHNGKPIRDYYRAWHSACDAAKLTGRIPHDFRRTAARNLIRAGVPTLIAKRLTGHKTDAVFERYGIVDKSMLNEAAAKLAVILKADKERPAKVAALAAAADSGTVRAK